MYRIKIAVIAVAYVLVSVNPAAAQEAGLLSKWSFDSVSFGTLYDVSGNGFHAYASKYELADGVYGKSLRLEGDDFEIVVPHAIEHFAVPTFSIEACIWSPVSYEDPGAWEHFQRIFNFLGVTSSPPTREGYSLYISDRGKVELNLASEAASDWVVLVSPTTLVARQWYHIVGTYDGREMRLYVNGRLDASRPWTDGYVTPRMSPRIGCERRLEDPSYPDVWMHFTGLIDELAVYDRVMPADEVTRRFLEGREQLNPPTSVAGAAARRTRSSMLSSDALSVHRGGNAVRFTATDLRGRALVTHGIAAGTGAWRIPEQAFGAGPAVMQLRSDGSTEARLVPLVR